MKVREKSEDELIAKISEILKDFQDFQKPTVSDGGDIIIKKIVRRKNKEISVLTNIFRDIIKKDIKKNRV